MTRSLRRRHFLDWLFLAVAVSLAVGGALAVRQARPPLSDTRSSPTETPP